MSTVRWVILSTSAVAFMSTPRISLNSVLRERSASVAWPQEEMMSMSMARCSGSSCGRALLRRWWVAKARSSVDVAVFMAEVNGRTRSAPNSAVAIASSSLPWRMDSSAWTSASWESCRSVGVGSWDSASVSPGSSARADSSCFACVFLVLRRVAAHSPPPARAATPTPPTAQPMFAALEEPAAASTAASAAPAQFSLVSSA